MRNRAIYRIFIRIPFTILTILLLSIGNTMVAQEQSIVPVADVIRVMELASDSKNDELWPGFIVTEIPVLIYDSLNTYLFNYSKPTEGFVQSDKDPGVWIYKGQHPLVQGNSIVRMGGNWIATSILSSLSRRTGEKYDLKDMAGIIVHEQFHIFQRTHHPGWLQNDGLLLRYPDETVEALFLRRMEKEAFKKAVVTGERKQMAGWAKLAMQLREDRLGLVANEFAHYENELQLSEGLSDYIEKRARELDPLNASEITNGIAPAGIRDLGYVEGRWMAITLDSLSPGWKLHLEKNDSLYLEDVLKAVVEKFAVPKKGFEKREINSMREAAEKDFSEWQARKKAEIDKFYEMPGYQIDIRSSANPLAIRLFEPFEMELLVDGGVYHRLIFMAGNESGNLRIRNYPCITWFNETYGITRLIINGLKQKPEINNALNTLGIKENGISIEINYSGLTIDYDLYIVDL